eukprot:2278685-Amphidinium_carterae.1
MQSDKVMGGLADALAFSELLSAAASSLQVTCKTLKGEKDVLSVPNYGSASMLRHPCATLRLQVSPSEVRVQRTDASWRLLAWSSTVSPAFAMSFCIVAPSMSRAKEGGKTLT